MNPQSEIVIGNICGLGISFSLEGFHILYAVIATFMWVMAILFSKEYMAHYENKRRYYVFTVITYLGTIGVFLSADLFTLFLFFEVHSFRYLNYFLSLLILLHLFLFLCLFVVL